jgi:hypothetical protein
MPSKRTRRLGQDQFEVRHFEAGLPGNIVENSYVDRSLIPGDAAAQKLQDFFWRELRPGRQIQLVVEQIKGDIQCMPVLRNPSTQKYIRLHGR